MLCRKTRPVLNDYGPVLEASVTSESSMMQINTTTDGLRTSRYIPVRVKIVTGFVRRSNGPSAITQGVSFISI